MERRKIERQMNNRLDKYFREQLADLPTMPSGGAWDKVDARISKKNNKVVALRVAAAIATIGLLTIILIEQNTEVRTQQVAGQTTKQPDVQKAQVKAKQTEPALTAAAKVESKTQLTPRKKLKRATETQIEKNIELQATVTPDLVVMETTSEAQIASVTSPEKKSKRILLVYTLPPIAKSPQQDVAKTDEEQRTGFQKVMDVAMDVRASESPLGELREAKDDLFALDFKKDKSKTKN
jgi:hypothetical protein